MNTIKVNLNEQNSERLAELARQTRKSPDELVNEAFARFVEEADGDEREKFLKWREALLKIEGMWKDRDDLPDFEQLRKSWDRDVWSR